MLHIRHRMMYLSDDVRLTHICSYVCDICPGIGRLKYVVSYLVSVLVVIVFNWIFWGFMQVFISKTFFYASYGGARLYRDHLLELKP